MADQKISELTELLNLSDDDMLPVVNTSDSITDRVSLKTIREYVVGEGSSYFPDYLEADQGVSGEEKSVNACIYAIGADDATLIFLHNSGGATTTYSFRTNETIPSNIRVVIEKGAVLSVSSGITLVINSDFDAGLYPVFSGDGSVNFGSSTAKKSYPEWWGAVGDGTTDDYIAINKFLISLATSGGVGIFGNRSYKITTRLLVDTPASSFSLYWEGYNSWIVGAFTNDQSVLEFRSAENIMLVNVGIKVGYAVSGFANHGLVIYNSSYISIKSIRVQDWKNTGILVYTSGDTYRNVIINNVELISEAGVANNGILFNNMQHSGCSSLYVEGVTGSPGYAVQFKDGCRDCWYDNVRVKSCSTALSFSETTGTGPQRCRMSGINIYDTDGGLIMGGANFNKVSDVYVDVNDRIDSKYQIHLEKASSYNVITDIYIRQLRVARTAASIETACNGNYIELKGLEDVFDFALVAGDYNTIVVGSYLDNTVVQDLLALFTDTGTGNRFQIFGNFSQAGVLSLMGSGTPEGSVVALIGSRYYRIDGGAGTSFYIKESGVSNTGWVAK